VSVPDRLSPTDRSSLTAERGSINMAIAGLILVERGPGVSYDALCRRIEDRIHLIPRYRQRLEQPVLGLANPVWVDDENFDVRWHVRFASLPAPGGDDELAAYIAREAARLMDRSRPLWELHLVEGLSGDRVAVIPKMHHALVDGMAAMGVGMILLDAVPEAPPVPPPQEQWRPRPYDLSRHLAQMATSPLQRSLRLALSSADRVLEVSPRAVAKDLRRATSLVADLALSRRSAPRLPLNGPISANRSYAFTSVPLDGVKTAAKAAGGTVNDAILAAVAGMLATWLKEAGVKPRDLQSDPVALVPVSVRSEGDDAMGNRVSIVFVDLPVAEPDPRRRIELVHERMDAIKASTKVQAGALMVDLTGFAPPLLSSVIARLGGGGGAVNLVVSNVPGPQFPMYLGGSMVLAVHPAVPLNPADQGLNVGVFSYNGSICFGLMADRDLDPPVERARAALDTALKALVGRPAAGARPRRRAPG
jgi:diacylglycerol O-acyltransferase